VGVLRSRSQVCLPRFTSIWKKGTSLRLGEVTLMTWAPYSAKPLPIEGPAIIRHSSRTLMPARICGLDVCGEFW
jgi:hypothetical protein